MLVSFNNYIDFEYLQAIIYLLTLIQQLVDELPPSILYHSTLLALSSIYILSLSPFLPHIHSTFQIWASHLSAHL